MNLPGYGDMFQCPYDKQHLVSKTRAQMHLIKCRKNHPDVVKVMCPFNATHLLNEPELKMHVDACPDRASFDVYKYNIQSTTGSSAKQETKPTQIDFSAMESEENWDDIDAPTYDPQQYTRNAAVLRSIPTGTRSQKDKFRQEEVQRLNDLQLNRPHK